MKTASIIIVEKDREVRDQLRSVFESKGFATWTCPSSDLAVSIFSSILPDVVVLDLDLEGDEAMDLLHTWKQTAPETRVYAGSLAEDPYRIQLAKACGADDVFRKPFPIEYLISVIEGSAQSPRKAA